MAVLALMKRPCRLGWGFLLAWVFCVFYTNAAGGFFSDPTIGDASLFTEAVMMALPLCSAIAVIVVALCAERRFGAPTSHRSLFLVAPALTAFSTPCLLAFGSDQFFNFPLFLAGAVLTGFGSGLLWVMWGEYYARVSQEEPEALAPVSSVLGALLVIPVTLLPDWGAVALASAYGALSGWCLFKAWNSEGQGPSRAGQMPVSSVSPDESGVFGASGRGSFGIFSACLFTCLAGCFWPEQDVGLPSFILMIALSIAVMAIIAWGATNGPRRISLQFLYRWMCPLLVAAFCLVVLFGAPLGTYGSYLISIAVRFSFCLITQMYFARVAHAGRVSAVRSFGWGWACLHLGDLVGLLIWIVCHNFIEQAELATIAILLLVPATMFVLNDRFSFTVAGELQASGLEEGEQAHEPCEPAPQEACAAHGRQTVDGAAHLSKRIDAIACDYGLTPRETEVFALLARGRSVPYIRDALVISKGTVVTHTKHIYSKLDVHTRQDLIDLVSTFADDPGVRR